jgi:general secretion pathway protein J
VNSSKGFTLVELLVAAAMLAFILVAAERAISTAQKTGEISERRAQQVRDLDRVWVLLENDLRNVISAPARSVNAGSNVIEAMKIDATEQYAFRFLRGGQANLLNMPRTELLRIGYRLEDEVLWRDSWIDPYNPDPELARPERLLDGLIAFEVMALPRAPVGRSVESGPWLDAWPSPNSGQAYLPLAVEITLRFRDERELRRLITLAAG